MNKINTDINYRYKGVNEGNQQSNVEINNLQVAQVSNNIVFARRVAVGVVGIGAVAAGYAAYNNSEILVESLRALGDYNIGSKLMAHGEELTTVVAGIMSYATLLNVGPEVLNVTLKMANAICHMAKALRAICITMPFEFLRPLVKMVIEGILYDGPAVWNLTLKFANVICYLGKVLLKGVGVVAPFMLKNIVTMVIESAKSFVELTKFVYEWRGTAGMALIIGIAGYYDPERVIDLIKWVYEQYENCSKSSRSIDWTVRAILQVVGMVMVFLLGEDGMERVSESYNKMIQVLSLICRLEYAHPYRGMLSMLGIVGVVLYYDLELAFSILEEMYQYTELALSEVADFIV